jgi:hypothetical protein
VCSMRREGNGDEPERVTYMTIDDFANTLRDQLISSGKAAESMVQDLEEKRASGLFGHISTAVHASVMTQYRKSAEQLLAIAPGDGVALTALDHAEKLTARIAKGASYPPQG